MYDAVASVLRSWLCGSAVVTSVVIKVGTFAIFRLSEVLWRTGKIRGYNAGIQCMQVKRARATLGLTCSQSVLTRPQCRCGIYTMCRSFAQTYELSLMRKFGMNVRDRFKPMLKAGDGRRQCRPTSRRLEVPSSRKKPYSVRR